MNLKSTVLALAVGFGVLAAPAANAAPLAPGSVAAVETGAGTTAAGYKHYGKRHYGKRHYGKRYYGKRHYGKRYHGKRYHKRYAYRPYHVKCYRKKIRVRSHYHYGWTYKFKKVCKRIYH